MRRLLQYKRLVMAVAVALLTAGLLTAVSAPSSAARAHHHLSACQRTVKHPSWCLHVKPFGHRCSEYAASRTNEDTEAALKLAHRAHANCEMDVWKSKDGIYFIWHDNTWCRVADPASLKRAGITDCRVSVTQVTAAQLAIIVTRGGQHIMKLPRAIKLCGEYNMQCMIELKWGVDPDDATAWINRYGCTGCSFYQRPMLKTSAYPCSMHAAQSLLQAGLVVGVKSLDECWLTPSQMAEAGYSYLSAKYAEFGNRPGLVRQLHQAGLKVGAGHNSKRKAWIRLVNRRVDFIIAPHPGALVRWLRG